VNQRGTAVFTWAAETNETSFAADISPLIQYLWRNGLISPGSNLGFIGFGSEGYYARGNVTFSASSCDVSVLAGPAPTLLIAPIPTATDSPSAAGRLRQPWLSTSLPISGIVGALLVFF
jgi:hypothetical protein